MHAQPFSWPTKDDYDMAMESLTENVKDPDLKEGTVKADRAGIYRFGGAGLYTTLYRVDNMMIRCFCKTPRREPPDDIVERYRHISAFTQRMKHMPNLVPILLVEKGIQVAYVDRDTYEQRGTEEVPFVKMPFIRGQSLGSFIFSNLGKRERMEKLCTAWLRLIRNLDRIRMAHGDLDLTNAIVTEDDNANLTLKLIDYDNTWIPELAVGYEQTEGGHEHFQHPAFRSKQSRLFNAEMDRFSALVIYISLKAITHSPDLYAELGADDTNRLLLDKADYVAEMKGQSSRIRLLRDKQIPQLKPLLDELSSCLQSKSMPCHLKDLLQYGTSVNTESANIQAVSLKSQNATMLDDGTYEVVYDAWDRVKWKVISNLASVTPQMSKVPDSVPVPPMVLGPKPIASNQSGANQPQPVQNIGGGGDYQVQRQLPYPPSPRASVSSSSASRIKQIITIILILLALVVAVVVVILVLGLIGKPH